MRARPITVHLLTTLLLACLCACGSTTYPTVTGNWTFSAVSETTPSEPPQTFTGTLTSSGSSITATLVYSNACFKSQTLSFSGEFSGSNTLKLVSSAYANQIVTLNGSISPGGGLLTQGSYIVTAQNSSPPICDIADTGVLSGARTSTP